MDKKSSTLLCCISTFTLLLLASYFVLSKSAHDAQIAQDTQRIANALEAGYRLNLDGTVQTLRGQQ